MISELVGIADQIEKHLTQAHRIGGDGGRHTRIRLAGQGHILACGFSSKK